MSGSLQITLKIGLVIDFDVNNGFLTFGNHFLCIAYKWVPWVQDRAPRVPRVPGSPQITLKIGLVIDFDVND